MDEVDRVIPLLGARVTREKDESDVTDVVAHRRVRP